MRTATGLALIALLTLAGCARTVTPAGPAAADPASDPALVSEAYAGRFRILTMVLQSPEHGPQLCANVMTSYPPQCGGPDIVGWDWSTVPATSANGTTWGDYVLVGTFDGTTFTLTEPAALADGTSSPQVDVDYSAPCPEPAGGWQVVDATRAGDPDIEATSVRARDVAGFAGLWIDQRSGTEDGAGMIVVVRTAGDVAEMRAAVREVWGGPLCIAGARFTEEELLAAYRDLSGEPGMVSVGVEAVGNRVDLHVFMATVERQRDLDVRFGAGLVHQEAVMEPLD